ncbi:hypothetical protein [Citrobacter amalonaticus]|uniref:hypothetical protein n=1 Tax=Citrobacter amalonaticus TaxID=35703 RepID=UPI001E5ECD76|nr:hypothetical protein [Citrobacter amalonaticus]
MVCQRVEYVLPGNKRLANGDPCQQDAAHQHANPEGVAANIDCQPTNGVTRPA